MGGKFNVYVFFVIFIFAIIAIFVMAGMPIWAGAQTRPGIAVQPQKPPGAIGSFFRGIGNTLGNVVTVGEKNQALKNLSQADKLIAQAKWLKENKPNDPKAQKKAARLLAKAKKLQEKSQKAASNLDKKKKTSDAGVVKEKLEQSSGALSMVSGDSTVGKDVMKKTNVSIPTITVTFPLLDLLKVKSSLASFIDDKRVPPQFKEHLQSVQSRVQKHIDLGETKFDPNKLPMKATTGPGTVSPGFTSPSFP